MAHTIAAVATANQPAAIGILRLSGDDAIAIAGAVFSPAHGTLDAQAPRRMVLGTLRDRQGRVIDQAMAVIAHGPASYTGEDTAEIHCHGAPAVLAAGLEALYAAGAQPAQPGEFTRRAFLNGKLDLTQAEAVADLLEAETAEQAANAAGQLSGAIRSRIDPIYDTLTDILAHFHAALDYPDEDIDPFSLEQYAKTLEGAWSDLSALLHTYQRGQVLRRGVAAVLLGRPNAGKSSLLNALAGYERVIVSEIPGTTRDTVEERVKVGGVLLRLIDTAGIRPGGDRLEQLGIDRAQQAALQADLALFVCDGSQPLTAEDESAMAAARRAKQVIAVRNKADLPQADFALPFDTVIPVSAKTGAGLEQLEDAVAARFGGTPCDGSVLTSARQQAAIASAADSIAHAQTAMELAMTPDAVLVDVEQALESLAELTGRTMREDIINRIFARFCVGK
jgi:tRNA modification GTPase